MNLSLAIYHIISEESSSSSEEEDEDETGDDTAAPAPAAKQPLTVTALAAVADLTPNEQEAIEAFMNDASQKEEEDLGKVSSQHQPLVLFVKSPLST